MAALSSPPFGLFGFLDASACLFPEQILTHAKDFTADAQRKNDTAEIGGNMLDGVLNLRFTAEKAMVAIELTTFRSDTRFPVGLG